MGCENQWMLVAGETERIHRAAMDVYAHCSGSAFLIRLSRWDLDWAQLVYWWQLRMSGGSHADFPESTRIGPPPFEEVTRVLNEAMH